MKNLFFFLGVICVVSVFTLSSFTDSGESGGVGPHGNCIGNNSNPCKITYADGSVGNFTGAYVEN